MVPDPALDRAAREGDHRSHAGRREDPLDQGAPTVVPRQVEDPGAVLQGGVPASMAADSHCGAASRPLGRPARPPTWGPFTSPTRHRGEGLEPLRVDQAAIPTVTPSSGTRWSRAEGRQTMRTSPQGAVTTAWPASGASSSGGPWNERIHVRRRDRAPRSDRPRRSRPGTPHPTHAPPANPPATPPARPPDRRPAPRRCPPQRPASRRGCGGSRRPAPPPAPAAPRPSRRDGRSRGARPGSPGARPARAEGEVG